VSEVARMNPALQLILDQLNKLSTGQEAMKVDISAGKTKFRTA
jgi:hypothetical protein